MARKKRGSGSKRGSGGKGKPAILSIAKSKSKRPAKSRVGKTATRKGKVPRKMSVKSRVKGRKY
tara:strand:+ start:1599 stop:1790 length:192 start_codon:yes stop_codon:yes gene_type:complete